ncbi:LacI family DNA-binding transcriptional regulator [Tropicimonas marinistellae]|uniref:LacI family DNA-binding transcriptional regulator n=1 Tax=Tropicimonas marinistellae TaxID=1739787 RepID=UPI00082D82CE|nr:LacI family DNA-binding transcriptional regulator [Tropicimonas marinistellae]
MARKVTLTDVARAAGVSIATVDRVINKRGGVDTAKEDRVIQVARTLGLDRRLDYQHVRIKRVTFMLQPPTNPFHAELRSGLDTTRKVLDSLNIQMHLIHIDATEAQETAGKILDQLGSTDGVILSAPDSPAIATALRTVSAEMPVLTLASDIRDSGRVAYVGPDDERSGRVAGDLLGRFLGERGGSILIVGGNFELSGHRARSRGFTDLIAQRHPRCWISRVVETREDANVTMDLVYRAVKDDPTIRGIYHLSVGASRIAQALEHLGRSADVFVVCHELTATRRRLLHARKIHAVIDQNPHLEVRLAAEIMAARLGRLEGNAESVETDVQIFMAENA